MEFILVWVNWAKPYKLVEINCIEYLIDDTIRLYAMMKKNVNILIKIDKI